MHVDGKKKILDLIRRTRRLNMCALKENAWLVPTGSHYPDSGAGRRFLFIFFFLKIIMLLNKRRSAVSSSSISGQLLGTKT